MPAPADSLSALRLARLQELRRLQRERAHRERRKATATWRTPGDLALALDASTVQTPALDLIDAELVRIADGTTKNLIVSMPPQEGKA